MGRQRLDGTIYVPTGEVWTRNPANDRRSILRKCTTCQKEFHADSANVTKGLGWTCSLTCAQKYKGYEQSVKCKCLQCGNEFDEQASRVKAGKGKYCSKVCYTESMKKECIPLVCEYCGKTFYRKPFKKRQLESGYVKRLFCSMSCTADARKTGEIVRCANPECNNEFYRCAAYEGKRKFCSRKCMSDILCGENHHLWKEDKTHRDGQEFTHKHRIKILDKYGWRCPVTKTHANDSLLEFHHIVPVSKGGTNDPSNGMPLHPDIHKKVTWNGFDILPYVIR